MLWVRVAVAQGSTVAVSWVLQRIWEWDPIASSPRPGCEAPTSTSATTPSSAASSLSVPGVGAASYLKIGWSAFPTVYLISCWGGEPAEESIEVPGSSRRVNMGNKLLFRPYFSMQEQTGSSRVLA